MREHPKKSPGDTIIYQRRWSRGAADGTVPILPGTPWSRRLRQVSFTTSRYGVSSDRIAITAGSRRSVTTDTTGD